MTEENVHMNFENYSPRKDFCLKWFEADVSKKYKECKEKSVADDYELQRKCSN